MKCRMCLDKASVIDLIDDEQFCGKCAKGLGLIVGDDGVIEIVPSIDCVVVLLPGNKCLCDYCETVAEISYVGGELPVFMCLDCASFLSLNPYDSVKPAQHLCRMCATNIRNCK